MKGQIAEEGVHEELLLDRDEIYARLWSVQTGAVTEFK